MEILPTLIVILILTLVAIFVRVSSILLELKKGQQINNAYNDDHYKQRESQNEILEQISTDIQQLKDDVQDMKYVSDVFYKYKLPSKKEREMIDEIEIDNEIFDGISSARDDT